MPKKKSRGKAAATDPVLKELRAFGLAYPGTHTKSPWPGHLDLAVKDKTFAYLSVEGLPFGISCKLPHSSDVALMLPFTEPTPYGLGKSGWVSAKFPPGKKPPIDMLKAWIDESYRAQAPKKLVASLLAGDTEASALEGEKEPKGEQAMNARMAIAWLKKNGKPAVKKGMARYAIPSDNAFGVPVGVMRAYAKRIGRNHALALELWKSGFYEARMLATFVDEPALVTSAQMDRWCKDFDNWAICDTACFHLFDRSLHAWKRVRAWANKRDEFVKRGAFALLASLALHDKKAPDAPFRMGLKLVERAASDERNFVKKAVSWALRGIGKRNRALNTAAVKVGKRLAASKSPAARWVGKDALRALERRKTPR